MSEASNERRVEKVVSGTVKTKKKSEARKFADVFITEDIHSVKTYVFSDVIVPAVVDLIEDIVVGGIRMVLRGDSSSRRDRRDRDRGYTNYSRFSSGRDDRRDRDRDRDRRRESGSRFDYEELVFETRGDAEAVRDELEEEIEKYGMVTVAALYDMADRTAPYTANRYGWTNIRHADIVRTRDGYIIRLPRAVAID